MVLRLTISDHQVASKYTCARCRGSAAHYLVSPGADNLVSVDVVSQPSCNPHSLAVSGLSWSAGETLSRPPPTGGSGTTCC